MVCKELYGKSLWTPQVFLKGNISYEKSGDEILTLFFGVNSKYRADEKLQNNLTLFEWVTRNKLFPNFWGRDINGETPLTSVEMKFLYDKNCRIVPIYFISGEYRTEDRGIDIAKEAATLLKNLNYPRNSALFLESDKESIMTRDFLRGYIIGIKNEGFVPGFRADTDAKYIFDREFSRGLQTDKALFKDALIWAKEPLLDEFNEITTTHMIHPDNWKPYAPSGIKRSEIALWQYGEKCHPIYSDNDELITFDVDLIRDPEFFSQVML